MQAKEVVSICGEQRAPGSSLCTLTDACNSGLLYFSSHLRAQRLEAPLKLEVHLVGHAQVVKGGTVWYRYNLRRYKEAEWTICLQRCSAAAELIWSKCSSIREHAAMARCRIHRSRQAKPCSPALRVPPAPRAAGGRPAAAQHPQSCLR